MKRKVHAVWGNCSAKWLFPSHRRAASLHINGRPGYLSGTHINLGAYRHRARRRVGVGCCYQSEMCWACLLGPASLCTAQPRSRSHSSEDWSLSLEKSLKELQELAHRFLSDYIVLGFSSIHQVCNEKAAVAECVFWSVWGRERDKILLYAISHQGPASLRLSWSHHTPRNMSVCT